MARALPRITKTHRWDRQLIARVEALAHRTGRPVQHVLDDAVEIGLEQIEAQIDARMQAMTPAKAWEEYVGSQTPQEFWRISYEQGARTYYEAAERYVRDLPSMFREEWATLAPGDFPDLDRLAELLAEYLEESEAGIYLAYLGDMLLGEGPTRQAAIEAAVQEYEAQGGYGDYPLLRSREELISRLDVSLGVRDEQSNP